MNDIMKVSNQPEYKSVGQLPIILLLILLFAFKYLIIDKRSVHTMSNESVHVEHMNLDKTIPQPEYGSILLGGTQGLFIQLGNPLGNTNN